MKRAILFLSVSLLWAGVTIIPTDATQHAPEEAYKFLWRVATTDQWVREGTDIDPTLGVQYGELPILLPADNIFRGYLMYPDSIGTASFDREWYPSFSIDMAPKSYVISAVPWQTIAVFWSTIRDPMNQSVTWEASYFRGLFVRLMQEDVNRYVYQLPDSQTSAISGGTRLLIIPAFVSAGTDGGALIRMVADSFPHLANTFRLFLQSGGTIYTEGNGSYLLELLGLLPTGTVNIADRINGPSPDMIAPVSIVDPTIPVSFVQGSPGIYTVDAPTIAEGIGNVVLRYANAWDPADIGKPAVVVVEGASAYGGKIVIMAGIPSAGDIRTEDDRQWMWSVNSVLYAFCQKILHIRSIYTGVITDSASVAPFAIPADDSLTFRVTIKIRNTWDQPLEDLHIVENKYDWWYYADCPTGPSPSVEGNTITWNIPLFPASAEQIITYRLRSPDVNDPLLLEMKNNVLSNRFIRITTGSADYRLNGTYYWDYRADLWGLVLFNAEIVADADLNWKNILGPYFQPFKVFMVMENKERTPALETKYVQYVPMDVPVYSVGSPDIPIIRTPGENLIDLLMGSEDSSGTIFLDIDSDGDPGAWLDFSSIHPQPSSATLTQIYWRSPWNEEQWLDGTFEDIDGDGDVTQDTNNDGIYEHEDPDDKIRAWRIEWDIGTVGGYQFFDPYVSWEIWIDPPDLIEMAKGAAEHRGLPRGERPETDTGFFYSNWQKWMECDSFGDVILKRLVKINFGSYEGFGFFDTSYHPAPGDTLRIDYGIIPLPRNEYIAVLNLGGREPTMHSPFPPDEDTLFAKVTYKTIWGKYKTVPIRTTYTYWTPLPNPLQFEYVNQIYRIIDPATGEQIPYLPSEGEAYIDFKVTASTEYSRYWIANVGKDFGDVVYYYDDIEGRAWERVNDTPDGIGDGVFGYITVTIPKGIGGYSIDLPRDGAGNIDWTQIFPEYVTLVDTNPDVPTAPFVVEYPFKYELYCPQILIPPALDDDNGDGDDDWNDDFGDRFRSPTGCLYDYFPPYNCEYAESAFELSPWDTTLPIEGNLAHAHAGWSPGMDGQYGDDLSEKLGETHLTLRVIWNGWGFEGPVEINKGATLVNEEIFGGSPWVQWSHALLAEAKGHHIAIDRDVYPSVVSLYQDTVIIGYHIYDRNEPHQFNELYDPWVNSSAGSEGALVKVHVGGRDPASLLWPDIIDGARIDPAREGRRVCAIPWAATLPDSHPLREAGYPKIDSVALLTVIIEVDNATGLTWDSLKCNLDLSGLGVSEPFLWYGVYPRPFVPGFYDEASGSWILGDDPRTFRSGWRFNSSEREVLFKIGDADGSITIPEVQSSRRVYFIYHIDIAPTLSVSVYDIPIQITGTRRSYGTPFGEGEPFTLSAPEAKFAVVRRNAGGTVTTMPDFVIAPAKFIGFVDTLLDYAWVENPAVDVRASYSQPWLANFDMLPTVSASFIDGVLNVSSGDTEVFIPPSVDFNGFWIGARTTIDAPYGSDKLYLSYHPFVIYEDFMGIQRKKSGGDDYISARGPSVMPRKSVAVVNGDTVGEGESWFLNQGENRVIVKLEVANIGNDLAVDPVLYVQIGRDAFFDGTDSSYDFSYDMDEKLLTIELPDYTPGQRVELPLHLWVENGSAQNPLELCCLFTTEFYGTEGLFRQTTLTRKFTESDHDTIKYGANLFIDGNEFEIRPGSFDIGDVVRICVPVHCEGTAKLLDVIVRVFGKNGVPVADDIIIDTIGGDAESVVVVCFDYTVSLNLEEIFVIVDPDSIIGEFDESDNSIKIVLSTGKGDPASNVGVYPNPFTDYTDFFYTLSKPVRSVDLSVYTVRHRLVRKFAGPVTPGYHHITWDGTDAVNSQVANGGYVYKFIIVDSDGKEWVFKGIVARTK